MRVVPNDLGVLTGATLHTANHSFDRDERSVGLLDKVCFPSAAFGALDDEAIARGVDGVTFDR